MNIITSKKDALEALIKLQNEDDTEMDHCMADEILCEYLELLGQHHCMADEILCEYLELLGQHEIVEEYEKIGKWYA